MHIRWSRRDNEPVTEKNKFEPSPGDPGCRGTASTVRAIRHPSFVLRGVSVVGETRSRPEEVCSQIPLLLGPDEVPRGEFHPSRRQPFGLTTRPRKRIEPDRRGSGRGTGGRPEDDARVRVRPPWSHHDAVAAAASVPSSFTSTNALWTTAEMYRSPPAGHAREVGAVASKARASPSPGAPPSSNRAQLEPRQGDLDPMRSAALRATRSNRSGVRLPPASARPSTLGQEHDHRQIVARVR